MPEAPVAHDQAVYSVGVDVGGTFTDVVVLDHASGRLAVAKVASTPHNQALGFAQGLAKLGVPLARVRRALHGTTVATNAILEGQGARVGMLITAGFRDLIEIGRGERTRLYDLKLLKQPPLVPRAARFEVAERTRADGSVVQPAKAEAVRAALAGLDGETLEAWAVCFLHAYANPANEETAAAALRLVVGDVPIACSSAVVPEYREYERFSTTVLNAYVAPLMSRYLADLEGRLAADGYTRPLYVMHSSGGVMTARAARQLPVATILSGPAGGVAAAVALAAQAGLENVITCDMGGTSTDVCLVKGRRPRLTTEAKIAGYPTRIPQVDLVTVGAGGGSIATVERGVLRVGPASAGARPGPACYGQGGEAATVTDAQLVLGRLDAGQPLAGEITLHPDLARAAVERAATRLGGLDAFAMAEGIVHLAVVKMANAIREVSVYRGHDPRDFVLLPFGGAGPMVASELARELGMSSAIVPPHPGNFSALGLLVSPLKRDVVRTRIRRLAELAAADLAAGFAELVAQATRELAADGIAGAALEFARSADLRYVGQSFTLNLPVTEGAQPAALADAFHAAHDAAFGHAAPGEPVELVNLRLAAALPAEPLDLRPDAPASGRPEPIAQRPVRFGGAAVACPVYERAALPLGAALDGPAVVQEVGSTTVVWPGDGLHVDQHGNLRLELSAADHQPPPIR
ncbi:MAG: hydantoinase/oxoprolinase family protein [Chloroflexi bacterium]|nr:hydantoinase/oxoprolinase family protein [Chloroflexota bacterium]